MRGGRQNLRDPGDTMLTEW